MQVPGVVGAALFYWQDVGALDRLGPAAGKAKEIMVGRQFVVYVLVEQYKLVAPMVEHRLPAWHFAAAAGASFAIGHKLTPCQKLSRPTAEKRFQ